MNTQDSTTLWQGVLDIISADTFRKRGASFDRRPLIARANALGGAAMHLLHWRKLIELGRIPHSDERQTVDAIKGINTFGAEIVEVFMVSHRWLRPSLNPSESHPDSLTHEKASAINEFSQWRRTWVLKNHGFEPEIFYWIDYSCIDQHHTAEAVPLLPLWVACCERFLRIETEGYDERAWCRVEALLSYVFSFADHHTAIGLDFRHRWPHFGDEEARRILDPSAGMLTNLDDMSLILPLIEVATRTQPANRSRMNVQLNETLLKCYRL